MFPFDAIKIKLMRLSYGIDSFSEFWLSCLNGMIVRLTGKSLSLRERHRIRRIFREGKLMTNEGNFYRIKDVKLPAVNSDEEMNVRLQNIIDEDIYSSYMYFDDKYDEKIFDICEKFLPEGLYGLVNENVNVTVSSGDVVIDAGSCCGSFSAYASAKGASIVYAFEPVAENFAYLEKTAKLNKNIVPVNKGLSNENTQINIFIDSEYLSRSSFLEDIRRGLPSVSASTVRLDDFVSENNLPRVDFIKCDIEGFERNMLAGAQETLKNFAPKLALCTYHLPDDPEVMAALIKQANPKYNIVQKRKKLFASVPE